MKQSGEGVVLGKRSKRNSKKTKRFQDEFITEPVNTRERRKSQRKKMKKSNSTSSSKFQKIKTASKPSRRKGKKPSHPIRESKKNIPSGEYEVFTDSEELKVTTSKVNSSKKGKKRRRKYAGDRSSLKNPDSKASKDLKKKERKKLNKKFSAKLNKLSGCLSSDSERSAKKKLMELMTLLEGSTVAQLREERKGLKKGEIEDKFIMICEEFIDGNHPTKILHKSWNEQFVKIMGSISDQSMRRQQMVMNLLTSADLTDDQRTKVFNTLENCTVSKLPFLQMTEDLLPSCNPLEFDQVSLMKKADLKLRHNGISKSWNLITSSSTPDHEFTKEEIMDYIGGDEAIDFFALHKKFVEI